MKVIIFDINEHIINVCKERFKDTDVECIVRPVSEIDADFIVTAGNSCGEMSGGIDLAVRNHFGYNIQYSVKDEINFGWNGFLPVGRLVIVPTRTIHYNETESDVQHLIYAPTMEQPGFVINKEDVYYVACRIFRFMLDKNDSSYMFRSVSHSIRILDKSNKSVAICGLGTCTGRISAEDFADAVYQAYKDVVISG